MTSKLPGKLPAPTPSPVTTAARPNFVLNDTPQLAFPVVPVMKALPAARWGGRECGFQSPNDNFLGLSGLFGRYSFFPHRTSVDFPVGACASGLPKLWAEAEKIHAARAEKLSPVAAFISSLFNRDLDPELRDCLVRATVAVSIGVRGLGFTSDGLTTCAQALGASEAWARGFALAVVFFCSDQHLLGFVQADSRFEGLGQKFGSGSPMFRFFLGVQMLLRLREIGGEFPEKLAREMRAYAMRRLPSLHTLGGATQHELSDLLREIDSQGFTRSSMGSGGHLIPLLHFPPTATAPENHSDEFVFPSSQDASRGQRPARDLGYWVTNPFSDAVSGIIPQPWREVLPALKLQGLGLGASDPLNFDPPLRRFGKILEVRRIPVLDQQASVWSWPNTSVTFGEDRFRGQDFSAWMAARGFRILRSEGSQAVTVTLDARHLTPRQVADKWEALARKI